MPTHSRPGRPRKNEIEERLASYTLHDEQVIEEHDTWLEIDVSTPTLPDQIMKIDKVDYEVLKRELAGRFFSKVSTQFDNQPTACVHSRNKDGGFNMTPNYVHSLICKHRGFLWHRNSSLLDNRRNNLETNLPLQSSTVGICKPQPEAQPYDSKAKHEIINLLTGQPVSMETTKDETQKR
jgi:hypothetical protein